jgi:hypothetical protein
METTVADRIPTPLWSGARLVNRHQGTELTPLIVGRRCRSLSPGLTISLGS